MLNIMNNHTVVNSSQYIPVIDKVAEANRVPIIGESEKQNETTGFGYNANRSGLNNDTYKNTYKSKNSTNNTSANIKNNKTNTVDTEDIKVNNDSNNTENQLFLLQNDTEFRKQINKANEQLNEKNVNFSYFQDKETGQVVVQIRDTKTNDLIKQIPPKEALAIAQNIDQLFKSYDKNGIQNKPIMTLPILDESA